ncbi:MAG TPA: hypothetical protein VGR35_09910 [Tepidisphaeraceae bacterium]|nr:hypothetical protein [Tepidisphaeraceae bacterium]
MRRLLIFLAALSFCGCGPTIREQVDQQFGLLFDAGKSLLVSVEAFRLGSGRWPASPAELRTSRFVDSAVGFDRYKNLRFEPLPNGGLAVKFDRWVGPGGTPMMSNVSIELPAPEPAR